MNVPPEAVEVLNEITGILIAGAIAYLVKIARDYKAQAVARTNGLLDEAARLRLSDAIERAIALAANSAGKVDLIRAVEYVKAFNGGDVAHFELDNDTLQTRITAQNDARLLAKK